MYNMQKTIIWSKTKIFFTFFAFVFSISIVFFSLLPIFNQTLQGENVFTILVGIIHALRMVEFLFILTGGQWFVWLFTTYMMNILALSLFSYSDVVAMMNTAVSGGDSGAPAPEA
ncbi:hypothetical protein NEAUS04_1014 [Nematocida ausubeli]|uniref:Uncharacterized protein n=1 Tax=Nematocida ausubeli (strain ATCC PRA-371 / ERTm2) TaxID=1913371 RepID=H8ZEA3_NEMA1|nr:uncharacterized protein NESG_01733 [Nematocida ausubeli]EHY64868.1 hypothetical protein NERG_01924 [Nematocida ausubeli]KAI5132875.1 hypothetical protein NEAUS06_0421 [Nematocida ausubeli]KAI5135498.1 hypothetical protein NEAUS07_1192 [Nematocida ausubeli]KAI5148278.1 hypothetical protein NEAUS05_1335 [Nematocida ausubeli]KAI5162309.1 hypothetical protein NEAUS04_1014 [Nematocida ausubeli]